MDRKKTAIHEAAHAVICHYAGIPIKKITLKGVKFNFPPPPLPEDKDFKEKQKKRYYDHVMIAGAGLIAEYLYLGESFLKFYDKEEIMQSTLNKTIPKETMSAALYGLQTFLAKPEIWGKVMKIADEIIDRKNVEKDLALEIGRTTRQRTPEHSAEHLIDFIVGRLYAGIN